MSRRRTIGPAPGLERPSLTVDGVGQARSPTGEFGYDRGETRQQPARDSEGTVRFRVDGSPTSAVGTDRTRGRLLLSRPVARAPTRGRTGAARRLLLRSGRKQGRVSAARHPPGTPQLPGPPPLPASTVEAGYPRART